MKIIEVSGHPRTIGRCSGEELREEIREHLAFPYSFDHQAWERRLPVFLAVLKRHLPDVLEEMEGMAEGANVPQEDILRLNLPMYPDELNIAEGCTNIAFAGGPDGPIWGKNNDGLPGEKPRPACARLIRRNDSIPVLLFAFCGMLATLDGMNAEGLAVGHSSVGSIFQQSDHHLPIRLWAYAGLLRSRTTADFVRHLTSLPTRGKGYSILCVDRQGSTCSIEAPCPVMQVRRSTAEHRNLHCINCYQLPVLADADRRNVSEKHNAHARWRLLDQKLSEKIDFSLEAMKILLRQHGDPAICRHGVEDGARTEYSLIGLPKSGRVFFSEGYPCENEFLEISL